MFLGRSLTVFLGLDWIHGMLIDRGVVDPPILLNYAFFALILVMSSSLADEVVRVLLLTHEVMANQQRWRSLVHHRRGITRPRDQLRLD
jgi:uncharacterized membrane protein YeiB